MKTRGITLASAKLFLHGLAFFAATPVLAQFSLALQRNNSSAKERKLPAVYQNYYSPATSVSGQGPGVSMLSFLPLTAKGNQTTEVINSPGKEDVNNNLPSAQNITKVNTDNLVISFRPTLFTYPQNPGEDIGIAEYPTEKLMLYAAALKQYAIKNGYDTTYVFLSNMGMLCNKKRFFVVNLVTMEIEQSGLVAQGRGQGLSRFDKQYSNTKESKCTSLGRYAITKKYKGEYGDAYRMAGLDSSNDNAYSRNIVLHSMGCIPDSEDGTQVCISEGCPAVSVNFLSSLFRVIDTAKKPVLLWVFDSNLEEVVIEQIPENTLEIELYGEAKSPHTCSLHLMK